MRRLHIAPQRSRTACGVFLFLAGLAVRASADTPVQLPTVEVVATSALGGADLDLRHFAGNVQVLNGNQLAADAGNVSDALNQVAGSVALNDTQGNPYQMDLSYRGFSASPVLGTPQGISVFVDGVRVNEPFGDVVSWDLIAQTALAKLTLIPGSNPVYGLNTLGGALSLTTKNGFSAAGSGVKVSTGSFARVATDLEQGGHNDNQAYYVAASHYQEHGWAQFNPSSVSQLFGKYSLRTDPVDADLSLTLTQSNLHGNQTVPVSMLAQAAQGYTHPDYTHARSALWNVRLSHDVVGWGQWSGNVYGRHVTRDILNSNIGQLIGNATNNADCAAVQDCPAANLLAHYGQSQLGGNLQWSAKHQAAGLAQLTTLGLNLETGNTGFGNGAQDAYVSSRAEVVGVDAFMPQAQVLSRNRHASVFGTDTVYLSPRLSLTASLRYDLAQVRLNGWTCTDADALCTAQAQSASQPGSNTQGPVVGQHSYRRLNPALGATFALAPGADVFANYSQGMRTPSAIELACADPASPCNGLPNAFGADPALKAVVSSTYEVGWRDASNKALRWSLALFRSELRDDIVFNQTNASQGYFSNIARTLRQGLEWNLDGSVPTWDYGLGGLWLDARFKAPFAIANPANSACLASANGCTDVLAHSGNHIPGLAAVVFKGHIGVAPSAQSHVGLSVVAQGPQYARGDENNADSHGRVPGFASVKLDAEYHLGPASKVFLGINNLFNRRYANFGMLGFNNVTSGAAEQFRSVAAPFSIVAGVHARF